MNVLRILFLAFNLLNIPRVNSQVVCCIWLYFHPPAQPEFVSDNTVPEHFIEPRLENIFLAPEVCPKGFMPIHGRCRQIYSQPY